MKTLNHRWRYRIPLGIALGLAASAVVLAMLPDGGRQLDRLEKGRLLSECDGALRELVIHYVPDAAEIVVPTYRDFLRQLPRDVVVHVVCRSRAAFDDLAARLAPTRCVLSPVIVDHPITSWSRDRWLALRPAGDADKTVLLCPRSENGADVWPDRAGDRQVAADLAAALQPGVSVRSSGLYFDGGDVAADGETAFITPAMPLRNIQRTVQDAEELRARLSAELGRRVVLLDGTPDHHTAMYMAPVGNRTVLVGDPALAKRILTAAGKDRQAADWFPDGPDFSDASIARFDAAARQCEAAGYRVIRIPVIPGSDGRTFITYVNAIVDERVGSRIVYMPTFSVAEELNRAAAGVWTNLGYEVRRVRCDGCYRYSGTLHCLVNVLRRG
jgi:hypothetical protein